MLPQGQNKKGENKMISVITYKFVRFQLWLEIYLRMQPQAFAFIHSVMNEDQYTEPDREEVTRAVLQNFQVLH